MRKMFVEADGESALVDLYTRASRVVRCTDTKPDNVVVSLYDDGNPPRIALIDVDTVAAATAGAWSHRDTTRQQTRVAQRRSKR
jgi:hypothetical protein